METTSIISLVKESIQLPHLCVQGAEPQLLSSVHTDLSGEGVVSGWELQHLLVQVFLFSSNELTSVKKYILMKLYWSSGGPFLIGLNWYEIKKGFWNLCQRVVRITPTGEGKSMKCRFFNVDGGRAVFPPPSSWSPWSWPSSSSWPRRKVGGGEWRLPTEVSQDSRVGTWRRCGLYFIIKFQRCISISMEEMWFVFLLYFRCHISKMHFSFWKCSPSNLPKADCF